ncbi:MAG: trypsin-like serine protease [Polyangiaceae bacterium]
MHTWSRCVVLPNVSRRARIRSIRICGALPESQDTPRFAHETSSSAGDVATAEQGIRNGALATTHYATVKLNDTSSFCSAIQISKFHFLTSAHCLPNSGSGWIRAGISRQVCSGTTCYISPSPYSDMWVYMTRSPDYTGNGDYPDDIAVVTIYHIYDDGVTLPDPAKNDALGMRIHLGTLAANQAISIYGYGYSNESGSDAGGVTLRGGSMNVTAVNTGWFWSLVVNQAVCMGDSGGPAVVYSNKAAGLPTQYSGAGVCPLPGAYVVWSTIAPKMSWINPSCSIPLAQASSAPVTDRVRHFTHVVGRRGVIASVSTTDWSFSMSVVLKLTPLTKPL